MEGVPGEFRACRPFPLRDGQGQAWRGWVTSGGRAADDSWACGSVCLPSLCSPPSGIDRCGPIWRHGRCLPWRRRRRARQASQALSVMDGACREWAFDGGGSGGRRPLPCRSVPGASAPRLLDFLYQTCTSWLVIICVLSACSFPALTAWRYPLSRLPPCTALKPLKHHPLPFVLCPCFLPDRQRCNTTLNNQWHVARLVCSS